MPFRTHADRFKNGQPYPRTELVRTLTRIVTDEGAEGSYLGGGAHGDQEGLLPDDQGVMLGRIRSLLVGHDPFDREMIWKWLWVANIPDWRPWCESSRACEIRLIVRRRINLRRTRCVPIAVLRENWSRRSARKRCSSRAFARHAHQCHQVVAWLSPSTAWVLA